MGCRLQHRHVSDSVRAPVHRAEGAGASVRYVPLPQEDHGYAARESNLHVVAETLDWLNKYVKNATPRPTTASAAR